MLCSYLEHDILKKRDRHYFGDLQRTNLKKISEWGVIENKWGHFINLDKTAKITLLCGKDKSQYFMHL